MEREHNECDPYFSPLCHRKLSSTQDFGVFDFLRARYYKKDDSLRQKIHLFFCGALAGMSSLTATLPLDFIRVRLAMEKGSFTYKNNTEAISFVYRQEGILGFYKGYGAAVCGIFIYHGCSFFVFTKLKELVKHHQPESYLKWYVDFALGAISACGQLVAYPFDILRKRMQGQTLLLAKKEIENVRNYKELLLGIYR